MTIIPKSKIDQFSYFNAVINYHRTDDLWPNVLPNGTVIHVEAWWIADDNERFAGEWIFGVAENSFWLPERDLIIMDYSSRDEFRAITKQCSVHSA